MLPTEPPKCYDCGKAMSDAEWGAWKKVLSARDTEGIGVGVGYRCGCYRTQLVYAGHCHGPAPERITTLDGHTIELTHRSTCARCGAEVGGKETWWSNVPGEGDLCDPCHNAWLG